jgi:glycosyltransferase involved in cell wall biosynthesis
MTVLFDAMRLTSGAELHCFGDITESDLPSDIQSRVFVWGKVERLELADRMRQVDAVVVPSLCDENQPNIIVEAQALASVVLASKVGGIPELIEHGHDGMLFPEGDSHALAAQLRQLMSAPTSWNAMRSGAAHRAKARHSGGGLLSTLLEQVVSQVRSPDLSQEISDPFRRRASRRTPR